MDDGGHETPETPAGGGRGEGPRDGARSLPAVRGDRRRGRRGASAPGLGEAAVSRRERAWAEAPSWAWRALHPTAPEPFHAPGLTAPGLTAPGLTAPARTALGDGSSVLTFRTPDGWRLRCTRLSCVPGGTGEPVVLLPTLGLDARVFTFGQPSLAERLRAAGYRVYLGARRGDARSSTAAVRPPPIHAADIVALDLPALVEAVCEDAGAARAFVVGHGWGGQLAVAWAARTHGARLAGLAALSTPRFGPAGPKALQRGLALVGRLSRGAAPLRRLARWAAVAWGPDPVEGRGPARRGSVTAWTEDTAWSLLAHAAAGRDPARLVDPGVDVDLPTALASLDAPLWIAGSHDDAVAPLDEVDRLADAWAVGRVTRVALPAGFDHLDALVHPGADAAAFDPLVGWLDRRRGRCWSTADAVVHEVGARGLGGP